MTKAKLRKIYLAHQKSLPAIEREEKSRRIAERFFQSFDLRPIKFLHCFLPIEKFNEIDTKLIFEKLWCEFPHVKTLLPRVDFQTNEIESLKFSSVTKLVRNEWRIDEPSHGEITETKEIDIVLVPLLCFDKSGFRVGYGKGFYDRFLRSCRADCKKIGLSNFPPLAKISDATGFDVKLDFCVTPEEVFNCA